jgi:PAS domain-containing protein
LTSAAVLPAIALLAAACAALWWIERRRRRVGERRERWLQAIVDNIPAAVYVKAPDGRYLLINRRLEMLHATPRRGSSAAASTDFFRPRSRDRLRRNDRARLEPASRSR